MSNHSFKYASLSLDAALQVVFHTCCWTGPIQSTAATGRPVALDIPLYLKGWGGISYRPKTSPQSHNNKALHKQVSPKKRDCMARKSGDWDLFWEKLMALLSGTVMEQLFQKHKWGHKWWGSIKGELESQFSSAVEFYGL